MPETTIDNISTENESQDERSYQVLIYWCRAKSTEATVQSLMKAIELVGIIEAMKGFDRHLSEDHLEVPST